MTTTTTNDDRTICEFCDSEVEDGEACPGCEAYAEVSARETLPKWFCDTMWPPKVDRLNPAFEALKAKALEFGETSEKAFRTFLECPSMENQLNLGIAVNAYRNIRESMAEFLEWTPTERITVPPGYVTRSQLTRIESCRTCGATQRQQFGPVIPMEPRQSHKLSRQNTFITDWKL